MKVIGYSRVSTTKQELYRQRDKISKFCDEKHFFLNRIIEDFGKSGATNERSGYKQLLDLTNEDCDLLIISEISRLSRNDEVTETLHDIQSIILKGISVVLLDNKDKIYKASENLDFSELLILIFQLKGAAQERKDIKKKNQDGKMALFRRFPYIVVDSHIPYGYKKVWNNTIKRYVLEEYPGELNNVKKAFELILSGQTLYMTSKYFTDRNINFRNMPATVSYLSRMTRNDLYRGIRRRTSKYDDSIKPIVVEVRIKPAIPEVDFLKAREMIKNNNKYISRSIHRFNPLKGIFRCRCGKAMTVKDKKPQKGISKLTYRCSSVYPNSSSYACTFKTDEVGYDLTNTIMHHLFLQRYSEVKEFFNNNSEKKIKELREIINGLESKRISKEIEINNLKQRIIENQNKIIKLSSTDLDMDFIQTLNQYHKDLQQKLHTVESEIKSINSTVVQYQIQISQLKVALTRDNQIKPEISNEELSEIYHTFLEKVEYYPYNLMKGTYKIYYKSGQICYIIVNKVRNLHKAYALTDNSTIDLKTGNITFNYIPISHNSQSLTFPQLVTKTINIHDIFASCYVQTSAFTEISIDDNYRKEYLAKVQTQNK